MPARGFFGSWRFFSSRRWPLVVVIIALTIAFDLWVASKAGPIVGALAVAGLYLVVGAGAVGLALRRPGAPAAPVHRRG